MRFDPSGLVTATDVERAALALFGDPLRVRPALSQVTAVWSPGDGRNRVLKITERTPKSPTDHFVLGLARARADAILTTGAILRAQPSLQFDLTGPGSTALMRWRIDVHGLLPPTALVLTSGLEFDPLHPALKGPAHVVVFVPPAAADGIRRGLKSFKWTKVQSAEPCDATSALAWLRAERGASSISIEAGPRVATPLLESQIDQVLLSRYTRDDVDEDLVAGEFLTDDRLGVSMTRMSSTPVDADGWTFERWERPRS